MLTADIIVGEKKIIEKNEVKSFEKRKTVGKTARKW